MTRRNGWRAAPDDGVTKTRDSVTSTPDSQRLLAGAPLSGAVHACPWIVKSMLAAGHRGMNGAGLPAAPVAGGAAAAAGAGVIAYFPPFVTRAVTTANLIDPSAQVVLTSVCVGSGPTLTAPRAAPAGRARPNVAQPG